MPKKNHQLSKHEYEIYQKIHGFEEPVEMEQGKIQREKSGYVEKREKNKRKLKRILDDLITGDLDIKGDEDLLDECDEQEIAAHREISNARVHKHRLKSIEKHEDELSSISPGKPN